jgi:hypothetical protein
MTFAHRFPQYGTIGLLMIFVMQSALVFSQTNYWPSIPWEWITANATPVCWWGYILAVDAWIYRCKGESLLTRRRSLFALQCILSVAFWCLFEGYNVLMPGWEYRNLPADMAWRYLGYIVAFATIMPGMFLTFELLTHYGVANRVRAPAFRWNNAVLNLSVIAGAVFVVAPPLMPEPSRGYLWAFVWTGWFFLLEPFNYRRGAPSIYRDWEQGALGRTLRLFLTGAICGFLWEFWNIWAHTKWVYIFPVGQDWKLFEMPLAGFPGFLPFALEYFVMFHFIAGFYTRHDKLELH